MFINDTTLVIPYFLKRTRKKLIEKVQYQTKLKK